MFHSCLCLRTPSLRLAALLEVALLLLLQAAGSAAHTLPPMRASTYYFAVCLLLPWQLDVAALACCVACALGSELCSSSRDTPDVPAFFTGT
jgi:hypothetical protein